MLRAMPHGAKKVSSTCLTQVRVHAPKIGRTPGFAHKQGKTGQSVITNKQIATK
jgi:hypothetical protein